MAVPLVKQTAPALAVALNVPGNYEIATTTVRYFDNSTRKIPKVFSRDRFMILTKLIQEAYWRGPSTPADLVRDLAAQVETDESYFVAEWKALIVREE